MEVANIYSVDLQTQFSIRSIVCSSAGVRKRALAVNSDANLLTYAVY